jgi:transcriptional regulator with XRE-family HTH domain
MDEPTMMDRWRARLRLAVEQSPYKHSAIARDAGVSPETLSRILTGACAHPRFDTVARLAHASGVSVGWLLDELGYSLSEEQRRQLRHAAAVIIETITQPSRAVSPYPAVTTRDPN